MILLHNSESELSRSLLAAMPSDATSLDCTGGIPASYAGPTPSAYPSVVVDVPAYTQTMPAYDADGGLLGMTTQTVAAHQEALRMPVTWTAVNEYVDYINERAAPCE